jgi:putative membrane protein insertion efficiency factor
LERKPGVVRALIQAPIRFYQRFVSPALPRRCRYEPTCSAYVLSALRSYGIVRGLVLGGWRLVRCNPFSHGGYDPVEAQTLFRPRRLRSAEIDSGKGRRGGRREQELRGLDNDCAKEHVMEAPI